jgi:hypothetical protein
MFIFTHRHGGHNLGAWLTPTHFRGVSHFIRCLRVFLVRCCSPVAGSPPTFPKVNPLQPPIPRRHQRRWPVPAPVRRSASHATGRARWRVSYRGASMARWIAQGLVSNSRAALGSTWTCPDTVRTNYGRNFQTSMAGEDIMPSARIISAKLSPTRTAGRLAPADARSAAAPAR